MDKKSAKPRESRLAASLGKLPPMGRRDATQIGCSLPLPSSVVPSFFFSLMDVHPQADTLGRKEHSTASPATS